MTELLNRVTQGDCLEIMRQIPDGSVDMILCDLPYGTTACKWDIVIPFEPLWAEYERVIKGDGAIVLFGSEPFSSALRASNLKLYKYDWYWRKAKPNGFPNAKKMPLKDIETISIFYKKLPTYNPQGVIKIDKVIKNSKGKSSNEKHVSGQNGGAMKSSTYVQEFTNYPRQVLDFTHEHNPIHNTQKPVPLIEYLIKTYTNEGETVLDNCLGSGTTAVAAINTNRQFIGIERESEYVAISNQRITDAIKTKEATANVNE